VIQEGGESPPLFLYAGHCNYEWIDHGGGGSGSGHLREGAPPVVKPL